MTYAKPKHIASQEIINSEYNVSVVIPDYVGGALLCDRSTLNSTCRICIFLKELTRYCIFFNYFALEAALKKFNYGLGKFDLHEYFVDVAW